MHDIASDIRSATPMPVRFPPLVGDDPTGAVIRRMGAAPGAGWRCKPATPRDVARAPRIVAVRWRSLEDQPLEVQARTPEDSHLLCIALRRMDVRLSVSGRVVQDGVVTPGTLHVTGPGVAAKCLFRGAYDALHLHIDNTLIDECVSAAPEDHDGLPTEAVPSHDPVIEQLGRSLLASDQLGGMFGPIYADCVGTAIVSRMLAMQPGAVAVEKRPLAGLPKWRLRRVLDFIDAHLDQPIRLADVAAAAGLTPMHFAAQFRATTGLRPHEYLLRRRVEHAQILLYKNLPTVDVALAVGFQSQAHFTSVFKRFVGQPPHTWRRMMAA
jgi:AraC family transcriptional regulator